MTPGPDVSSRDKAVLVSMVPKPRGLSAVLLPTFPSTVPAVVDFFFFFPKISIRSDVRLFFFLLPLAVVEKPQRPLGPHGIVLSHAAPAS